MKTYIQPKIELQAIVTTTIICASVTKVKGNTPVQLGEHLVNTGEAR